jgi:hypothetical protein
MSRQKHIEEAAISMPIYLYLIIKRQYHYTERRQDNHGRRQQWPLSQQCRHIKEARPCVIHNNSTSISTTPLHREDESDVIWDGSASVPTNTRHSALARRKVHIKR